MEQTLYQTFCQLQMSELEDRLLEAKTPAEKAFWRCLLDLKLQMAQEQVIHEALL